MGRKVIVALAACCVMCAARPVEAGHWALAFWRSLPKNEASNNLFVRVWTFNENGEPVGGVQIRNPQGALFCTTDIKWGRADFTMSVSNEYQCLVYQSGSTSDLSPYMSIGRFPNWGHYSYELGFMYKSDANNPGEFDQSIVGGAVPRLGSTTSNAPCTASMAYYSNDPSNWACDDGDGFYPLPAWGEHMQSFVASGNRVACVQFHPTVGGMNNQLQYTCEIRADSPSGPVIASRTSSVHYNQDWWVVPFGTSACPVTPGQTYYARIYTSGGFNAYYSSVNFAPPAYPAGRAAGMAYYRANSSASWAAGSYPDLKGFIVCCNVAANGAISGNVKDSTGANLVGVTVAASPGGYSAATDSSGNYTIAEVAPGTYDVTASRSGYAPQTLTGRSVTTGQTTTCDFTLTDATPPFAPVVTDDGVYTANLTQIGASWSSSDAESGIAEYQYAIGTSEGGTDSLGWTSAGTGASAVAPLALTPGVTYFFTVKARNGAGIWSATGSSNGITAAVAAASIGETKRDRPDGDCVALTAKVITRKSAADFWVQEPDRSSGIRVSGTTTGAEGSRVSVSGILGSVEGGERVIQQAEIGAPASGSAPAALGMPNARAGGSQFGQSAGPDGGVGLNNAGLLVKTWGEVLSAADDSFTVNDGSAGGLKIVCGPLVKPPVGHYVTVTGICGLEAEGEAVRAVVRVMHQGDIFDPSGPSVGAISGRVSSGGAGVSGAAVSTSPGGYSAVADSNGDYSIADVAPGVYEVTATAPGYTPRTLTGVTVNAGETAEASFALAVATGTISGIVTNKDGAAMAGVTVTTGTGGYSAATGAGGSYTISGVAAGTYSVTAAKQGYQPETRSGVVVTGGQTTACSFSNIYVALQEFETAPVWTTSFDAPWGNPATFAAVTGGVSGNFLQASRGTQGSSSRVLVYSVPANATLTLSCSMKCPSYPNSYWVESAYRLGSYSAEDFDSNSGSWTLVKKFSNSGADNGNGNVWTKYSKTISTGSNTQISVGFKHGALGYTGPAVGWDGLLLD